MKIEFHPAIEQELRQVIKYYNNSSNGLGNDFLDEFEQHVLKIETMPFQWPIVDNDIRRSLMRRFPYVIYFRMVTNDLLRVIVVKHQRRHPRRGLSRR